MALMVSSVSRSMNLLGKSEQKVKHSKQYMQEVNKSFKTLGSEVRDSATGSAYTGAQNTMRAFKQAMREEKKGFYKTQLNNMIKRNFVVSSVIDYTKALKGAFKTGKLFRSQGEVIDSYFQDLGFGGSDSKYEIEQDYFAAGKSSSDAIYDAASAQVNAYQQGSLATLKASQSQTGEMKMGFSKLNASFMTGLSEIREPLNNISNFLNNDLKDKVNQSLEIHKQHLAIATETRDILKAHMRQDLAVAKASIEKNKTFMDLLFEGNFRGAMGKGWENVLKDVDKWGIFTSMLPQFAGYLQTMKDNPLDFVKQMIMGTKTMQKVQSKVDPRAVVSNGIYGMMGSKNKAKSLLGRALNAGEGGAKVFLDNSYEKGAMSWNGLAQKSLVDVIPTYLRKILATLNGQQELIFNYKDGVFTTQGAVREQLKNTIQKSTAEYDMAEVGANLRDSLASQGYTTNVASMTQLVKQALSEMTMASLYSPEEIFKWSWTSYKKYIPNTVLNEKDWTLIKVAHFHLMAGKDKASKDYKATIARTAKSMRQAVDNLTKALSVANGEAGLTGLNSIYNGSDAVVNKAFGLGAGGSFRARGTEAEIEKKRKQYEEDIYKQQIELLNIQQSETSKLFQAKKFILEGDNVGAKFMTAHLSTTDIKKLMERAKYLNANDMKHINMNITKREFMEWVKEKKGKLPEEMQKKIEEHWANKRYDKLRAEFNIDVDTFVNEYTIANLLNGSQATSSEKEKHKQFKELIERQKHEANTFEGLSRAFTNIEQDDDAKGKLADVVRKVVMVGGGAALFGGNMVGAITGAGGLMAPLLAGAAGLGLAMFANKSKISELINPHLSEEEKASKKKVTDRLTSKIMTGLGIAGMTGLGMSAMGLFIPSFGHLAPIAMAATGVAGYMLSEKEGIKNFFFGDARNKDKTFYQLTKEKFLGDGTDDGLIGKWMNPMIDQTKSLIEKTNTFLKDKVFDKLTNTMKGWVDKLDQSKFGKAFQDAMGFSIRDFNQQMKENVWKPLTGGLLGSIKKLFGWGKDKLAGQHQDQRDELGLSEGVADFLDGKQDSVFNQHSRIKTNTIKQSQVSGNVFQRQRQINKSKESNGKSQRYLDRMNFREAMDNNPGARADYLRMRKEDLTNARKARKQSIYDNWLNSNRGLIDAPDKKTPAQIVKDSVAGNNYNRQNLINQNKKKARPGRFGLHSGMGAFLFGGSTGTTSGDAEGLDQKKKDIAKDLSDGANAYYNQYDPDYADIRLGPTGLSTIAKDGCAIMAGAMALSRIKKQKFKPEELVPLGNKHYSSKYGIHTDFFRDVASANKLEYGERDPGYFFTVKELASIFRRNGVVIALVKQKKGPNHYIVLKRMAGDIITYDDPARKRNMTVTYNDLIEASNKMMLLSKTGGLFGFLGKIIKGVMNKLTGETKKNRIARKWGLEREYLDRMTPDEFKKYRYKSSLPPELVAALKHDRRTEILDKEGKRITVIDADGKERYDATHAYNVHVKESAGSGATGIPPSKKLYENKITSISKLGMSWNVDDKKVNHTVIAATVHQTHVMGTWMEAIYKQLQFISEDIQDGTNGVPYNLEALKRAFLLKNFPGLKEETVTGKIDSVERKPGLKRGVKVRNFFRKINIGARRAINDKIVQPWQNFKAMVGRKWEYALEKTPLRFFTPTFWKKQFSTMGEKIKQGIFNFKERLVAGIKAFGAGAKEVLESIGTVISSGLNLLDTTIASLASTVVTLATSVVAIGETIVKGVGQMLKGIGNMLVDTITASAKVTREIVSAAYDGVKTVVKDVVGGVGKLLWGGVKMVGTGVVAAADIGLGLVSKSYRKVRDKVNEAIVRNVRVVGGHIDTVGVLGAIDRDTYVKYAKAENKVMRKEGVASENSLSAAMNNITTGTFRNDKDNKDLDKSQDTEYKMRVRMLELLEGMRGAGNTIKSSAETNSKDVKLGWKTLLPFLPMLGLPFLGKFKDMFNLKNLAKGFFQSGNPFAKGMAMFKQFKNFGGIKGIGRRLMKAPKAIGRGIKGWFNNTKTVGFFKGAKSAYSDYRMKYLDHLLQDRHNFTDDELAKFAKGEDVIKGKKIFANVEGGKAVEIFDELTGDVTRIDHKYAQKAANAADDIARKAAEKAAKNNAIKQAGAKQLAKVGNAIKNAAVTAGKKMRTSLVLYLNDFFTSPFMTKILGPKQGSVLARLDKFIDGLMNIPAVKSSIAKKAGSFLKFLGGPWVTAAFAVADFVLGYKAAGVYFGIPDSDTTEEQKLTAGLVRTLQGLAPLLGGPFLIFAANLAASILIPTGVLVKAVYGLFASDEAKAKLESDQAKTLANYNAYQASLPDPSKAESFEKWLKKQDKEKTKAAFKEASKNGNVINPTQLGIGAGTGYTTSFGVGPTPTTNNPYKPVPIKDTKTVKSPTGLPWSPVSGMPTAGGVSFGGAMVPAGGKKAEPAGFVTYAGAGNYQLPTSITKITSSVDPSRTLTIDGKTTTRPHKGVDFATPNGTPVYAVGDGKVVHVSTAYTAKQDYGAYVAIKHPDGLISKYAHLSKVYVTNGKQVKKGELIGLTGSSGGVTGPHLHFEFRNGLASTDKVYDPETLLPVKKKLFNKVFGDSNKETYGPGRSQGFLSGLPKKISEEKISQNYNIDMSVGGDKMTLAEVGCGPVTVNLFLQRSGFKEPLQKTIQNLKDKRKPNSGFEPSVLANYINGRGVNCKIVNKIPINEFKQHGYGIVFARKTSFINGLQENHSMFVSSATNEGINLYDPVKETTKFYTYSQVETSCYSYISVSGKSNTDAKGPGSAIRRMNSPMGDFGRNLADKLKSDVANFKSKVNEAHRTLQNVQSQATSNVVASSSAPTPVVIPQNNNNGIEHRLDTLITLVAKVLEHMGTPTTPGKPNPLANLVSGIMNQNNQAPSQQQPASGSDAWMQHKAMIAQGGKY